ncbi:Polysaccharide biosynthesis protein [Sulfitobacter noctilucicola]|uniref:PST family polysaccharide transporter n=1 Tax=Sulfitobacter noctilucicola TaxID=1342301 RepID=A0A7W6M8Z8_9RHOB|nr:oligosaccharide flippase family protein [Sulfitobacter noctilucicola]KIN64484.1 Polysaccharide biosynthesis protein [Sulfitobacter noctilucicola]MBB4174357.1 PST family polysaccharide transporter [Sulfitobacter noctilucicola]
MPFSDATKSLATNLIAYGASEVAAKASRLLVVVAVARTLDLTQIGIAASAMAAGDLLKALTENGVGQRIIAASDDTLEETCTTARRIFWVWCLGLCVLQTLIAGAMYFSGGSVMLSGLILLMGLEYLFMPAGLVQVALAMRAGKMRQTAAIGGTQVVGANLLSIMLVLIYPSAIALILPRVLSAPIWLFAVRALHPWNPKSGITPAPLRPFITYGWAVLGIEVVKVLRLQGDKIVVGLTMGPQALGLYFMAFNAGLSLSTAFATAFSTVLFPHLSQSSDPAAAMRQSIIVGLSLIAPVVILQSALAPLYVPLLLGDGWDAVAPLVSILCLVAIPTTLWATAAGWLRVQGKPQVELWMTCALAAAVLVSTAVLAPLGLFAMAVGYLVVTSLLMVIGAFATLHTDLFPSYPQVQS